MSGLKRAAQRECEDNMAFLAQSPAIPPLGCLADSRPRAAA